jgi:hypothetical protein
MQILQLFTINLKRGVFRRFYKVTKNAKQESLVDRPVGLMKGQGGGVQSLKEFYYVAR